MRTPPRISVLLPVRDAAPWLPATLASLTRQSLREFEVIAVDDGSRDDSLAILEGAAARDPRIRVIARPHEGLPRTLETARRHAAAPLLARHDADDLSHRHRFALQAAHLEAHPEVAVVGSRVRLFPQAAFGPGMRRWGAWHDALLTHDAMARERYIDSPLANGCAMLRAGVLEAVGGWRELGWAEDLDLWLRLFEHGARFAKLPRTLYGWRQHAGSATRTDPRYALDRFRALKVAALDRTLLAGGTRVTLVGVGASLERWRAALGTTRVREVRTASRPDASIFTSAEPPFVLVFMSRAVRERWRRTALENGMSEMDDFLFVT